MKNTVQPHTISLGDYSISGVSTAGIGTCLTIPQWKICLDVAQGLPFAFSMKHFLISHMHQDHASGIPYLISQKAMQSHKPPVFYFPSGMAGYMEKIMNLWSEMEGHTYDYLFKEIMPGQRKLLTGSLFLEPFETLHRVKSQGYTIYQRSKRLNKKFQGLSRLEILDLKEKGVMIEEEIFHPKVSFTGDTQIEFLDLSPQVKNAETLIMEVTYIDEKRGVESARKWGHIHFQEIWPRIAEIKSKNIIWIHLSARHSKKEVQELINKQLPDHKDRIHLI